MANIIDLGFDVEKLTREQVVVIEGLNKVYEAAMRLDGVKVSFGNAEGFGSYKKAIDSQNTAINDLNTSTKEYTKTVDNLSKSEQAQGRERIAELKLQKDREKAFDDYEKKQQKAFADEQTRTAKAQQNSKKAAEEELKIQKMRDAAAKKAESDDQKELARMVKLQKAREDAAKPFNILKKAAAEASDRASNLGARFGMDSEVYKAAAADAAALNTQVQKLSASSDQASTKLAKSVSNVWSFVRQAAYILPGIGIAGIFGLLSDGIVKLYTIMANGENTLRTFADLNKKTNDILASQKVIVQSLVLEVQNKNTTQSRQIEIIEQLNKISPTYFGNLKNESDIVKKLPEDYKKYNEALLLTSRIQASQGLITEKYKSQLEFIEKVNENLSGGVDIIDKIANSSGQANQALGLLGYGLQGSISFAAKQIPALQNSIDRLQQGIIKDSQELQKKGGDIAGDGLKLQERIANSLTDVEKNKLQTFIDVQNSIVENDKKSYSARQLALKKSTDAQKQLLALSQKEELNDVSLMNDQRAVIVSKGTADLSKINVDYNTKKKELEDKSNKQDVDNFKQSLEFIKKSNKLVVDDETLSLDTRLGTLDEYYQNSIDIIDANEKQQVKEAGDNEKTITNIHKQAENDRLDAKNEVLSKSQTITDKYNNDQLASDKKFAADHIKEIKDQGNALEVAGANRMKQIEKDKDSELVILADKLKRNKIDEQEYNDRRAETNRNYQKKVIEEQLSTFDTIIALFKEQGVDTTDLEKKAADARVKIAKNEADSKIAISEEEHKSRIEKVDQILQYEKAASEVASAFTEASFERRKNDIAALENKQQESFDTESKRIRESSASEQEKADQLAILSNKRLTEKAANDKKERQLDIEKAKFDKEMALFNAGIQLASLIIKYGVITPQAILAEVLGLAQIAVIAAKDIPKYAEGTDNHPGGKAWVGEGKYKEKVNLPGGKSFIADHAMLMDLPAGTSVEPLHGDYVNQSLNNSLIRGMAYTNGLTMAMERKGGDQAWKIASWQTAQMKKFMNKKPINNIKVVINSGFNDRIEQQVLK